MTTCEIDAESDDDDGGGGHRRTTRHGQALRIHRKPITDAVAVEASAWMVTLEPSPSSTGLISTTGVDWRAGAITLVYVAGSHDAALLGRIWVSNYTQSN